MLEVYGESAVATPDGKARRKISLSKNKLKNIIVLCTLNCPF